MTVVDGAVRLSDRTSFALVAVAVVIGPEVVLDFGDWMIGR